MPSSSKATIKSIILQHFAAELTRLNTDMFVTNAGYFGYILPIMDEQSAQLRLVDDAMKQ